MALRDVILATQADLRANADHAIATFTADSVKSKACEAKPRSGSFPSRSMSRRRSAGQTQVRTPSSLSWLRWPRARKSPIAPMPPRSASRWRASPSGWKDFDLRGFFAVKDDVRAGFSEVRGVVNLKSSAPAAELAKLKEVVDAHCPVLDILRAPLPVDIQLETERVLQPA